METFFALLALVSRNHRSPVDSRQKGPKSQWCWAVFSDVSPNKLLNKPLSLRWSETAWHWCYVTAISSASTCISSLLIVSRHTIILSLVVSWRFIAICVTGVTITRHTFHGKVTICSRYLLKLTLKTDIFIQKRPYQNNHVLRIL